VARTESRLKLAFAADIPPQLRAGELALTHYAPVRAFKIGTARSFNARLLAFDRPVTPQRGSVSGTLLIEPHTNPDGRLDTRSHRPPAELMTALLERVFRVERYTPMPSGGHFAALEQPERLATDIAAFFRPLRYGNSSEV
jgi:hypothetical protein